MICALDSEGLGESSVPFRVEHDETGHPLVLVLGRLGEENDAALLPRRDLEREPQVCHTAPDIAQVTRGNNSSGKKGNR